MVYGQEVAVLILFVDRLFYHIWIINENLLVPRFIIVSLLVDSSQ